MKNLAVVFVLLFTLIVINDLRSQSAPQIYDYDSKWKEIDSLYNYGLPESAMKILQEVFVNAKGENNTVQYVRALLYKMKLIQYNEEDAFFKSLSEMKSEEAAAVFPMKQFLNSLIGDMYWTFYQNNRYDLLERTRVENFTLEDIKTWDATKIIEQSIQYYKNSISEPERLQQVSLEGYNDMLNNYVYDKYIPNGRKYRPTLYDFLAFKAIGFFSNKEAGVTRPAEQFLLNDPIFMSDAKEFSVLDISTKDVFSFDYYAITILRDVIRFHLNDGNVDALVDADLKRLEFVYNSSGNAEKENLYLKALQNLLDKYSVYPVSTLISYEIANVYQGRGAKYVPGITDNYKDDLKIAYSICKDAADKYLDSDGAQNCRAIMAALDSKSIQITLEAYNIPDKPFRSLVTYKNVNKLYYKIVETSYDEIEKIEDDYPNYNDYAKYNDEIINRFNGKDAVHNFNINLPNDGDLQTHKTEVKIPSLKSGVYVMLVGTSESFSYKENAVAYCLLNINSLSYINKTNEKKDIEFYTLNRDTGYPLDGAEAVIYVQNYDYNKSRYEYIRSGDYTADKNGYFSVKSTGKSRSFYVELRHNGQFLTTQGLNFGYGYSYIKDAFYQGEYYEQNTKPYTATYFFTDRSLYRPGQTLYFKGLVVEAKGKESSIKAGEFVTVELYDVNSQKVSEQSFTTNDFGTINGSFTLPTSGLNGQMRIQTSVNNGSSYFSVEDYKRPKFEVTFNPIKGTYKLGELVPVRGIAKSYSGANLDNAAVKYKVVRKALYPRWFYDWYSNYFGTSKSNETVILNGTTTTNNTGEFEINFKAIPDESVSTGLKAYFNYEVTADVTDINGETHSKEMNVAVGYSSLMVSFGIGENVDKNGDTKFRLVTTNLNGEREGADTKIEIYKLKSPERAFRSRLWQRPDKFTMTKEEYYRDFPYDEYSDESDFTKWEKELKAYDKSFSTEQDSVLDLSTMKGWNQGKYVAELKAKDKNGEEVSEKFYFTAYSKGESSMPFTKFSNHIDIKSSYEVGETAEFIFGTSLSDTKVLFEVNGNEGIIKREWLTFNKEQRLFELPVREEYRGGIGYNLVFVKENRLVSVERYLGVPYTNKMLDISFETFRDKLKPRDKEEWKIKIKGKNGDKAMAEMVATMYDASLDAIKDHGWNFNFGLNYSFYSDSWGSAVCFDAYNGNIYQEDWNKSVDYTSIGYDFLNFFGAPINSDNYYAPMYGEKMAVDEDVKTGYKVDKVSEEPRKKEREESEIKTESPEPKNGKDGKGTEDKKKKEELGNITTRTDFRETVFFLPELRTDENGDVTISFEMPDVLTRWKLMGFAHTKDLKRGMIEKEIITQKELMVTPNVPRYFREDDKVVISAKVTNLSDRDLKGDAALMLFDGLTMKGADGEFKNLEAVKGFEVSKGGSTSVSWEVTVPYGFEAVDYRVTARAENFTDGEESVLPVLSNRMLVTETMPMNVRGNETKSFSMKKLVNGGTMTNYRLSVEFTSNPAWYAVQSLPYLMEFPYECAEQVFSRVYANSIAGFIANSSPKIKEVFERWRNESPDALLSNLEKNEELKGLILQESPWVREAKNESERKRRIGVLFEVKRMESELGKAVKKLKGMQVSNGAWAWFEGMPEDRYMTQYITAGFGKLHRLGIRRFEDDEEMVRGALGYLDGQIRKDYDELLRLEREGRLKLSDNNLGALQVHYLYMRSFYKDEAMDDFNREAFDYFKGQAAKFWNNRGWYLEGMIALALSRFGDGATADGIVRSLRENSLFSDEMGMYWKENAGGFYWYEAPIETQALLIEVFDEVGKDEKSVDDMKVWLLKNKQTNDWKTTKATTEAVYALLLRGEDWLAGEMLVDVRVGSIDVTKDVKAEVGTGYFKTSWKWGDVKSDMGNVTVTRKTATGISWGALYWQYFEDLDKITRSETGLSIEKKLFVVEETASGEVISPIGELKVGDKVRVRIELRSDRAMEYVHMKDMRAAGFEPVSVLSGYKYRDGLGYYESTRDAATNFFFGYLPKGTFVFEYDLRVNLAGDFSNGITSIQCMYAPEFSSHSEGVRVVVR
ncbi:MAG: alpha-2-macroglobulin family protein [Candidatus Kapaibacterium sp.]